MGQHFLMILCFSEVVMVDEIRWYGLLSFEQNCWIVKGPNHSNLIFCGIVHL